MHTHKVSTLKIVKDNGFLHVKGTVNGKRFRKSTGYRIGDDIRALAKLREWEADLIEGRPVGGDVVRSFGRRIFDDAVNEYIKSKRLEGKPLSSDQSQKVEAMRDEFGELDLAKFNDEFVEAWMLKELDRGLKHGSMVRQLSTLKSILKVAAKKNWMPALNVKTPAVDDARDEHFEINQIERYLRWCKMNHPKSYLLFVLLIDTGVRIGEACSILLEDLDMDRRVVHVRRRSHGKTTRSRSIPMSDRLYEALKVVPKHLSRQNLLMDARWGETWFSGNARSVTRRARDVLREGCRAIRNRPLRVHDLRHTFAYQAAVYGADIGDLQLLMGHANISMTMRYRGWVQSRAESVIAKFGSDVSRIGNYKE